MIVGLLLLLLIVSSERQAMLSARSSAGYGFILRSSVDDPNNRFKPANDPILQVTIQPVLWSEDLPVLTRKELVNRSG